MLLTNLLLALAWMALTGAFDPPNLFIGFALGYALLWVVRRGPRGAAYFVRAKRITSFTIFFLKELIRANLRVAHDVLTLRIHMKPAVVAIPLDAETDAEITLLANLITMTPGTLSLEVSEDRSTLYLHAMFVDDPEALRREIKEGFERRLLEVMR